MTAAASTDLRQYAVVTGNYWAFTLTDGALRMLVVLHFHQLGYGALQIALLFLFYEFFGVVTNLLGGWLGARIGLNRTMHIGLALQVLALAMLAVPTALLVVPWVMAAQALSGIAKDLNKMSAKASVKLLVPEDDAGRLYRWVARLTGSKNALKGAGFFLGGVLLAAVGFRGAVLAMAAALLLVWLASLALLRRDLGRARARPKFRDLLSKSRAVNALSAARLFLFGARDVWFVVALPVFLSSALGWDHWRVGAFLAAWVIGYGMVQALAPRLTGRTSPGRGRVVAWAAVLALAPAALALALADGRWPAAPVLVAGLTAFGVLFAVNSAVHSYLIVRHAQADGVSLDVGFYYMANAMGRLLGTVLSGWLYQAQGLVACLWVSALLVSLSALAAGALPRQPAPSSARHAAPP
ncbi:MAG: organoarsenical effux MFS transporter ArsJ [Gammaproteobacteria bacterium]